MTLREFELVLAQLPRGSMTTAEPRRMAIAILLGQSSRRFDTEPFLALAAAQSPRPGRWYEGGEVLVVNEPDGRRLFVVEDLRKTPGDGRLLSQADTDYLITVEIHRAIAPLNMDAMLACWHRLPWPKHDGSDHATWMGIAQRGGLHTDPLARAIALALWGERDAGISRAEYDARSAGR